MSERFRLTCSEISIVDRGERDPVALIVGRKIFFFPAALFSDVGERPIDRHRSR